MPDVARVRPAAQLPGDVAPELQAPLPNALMRDADAPFGQGQLHLTQAQAKHMVEPEGMADDLGREAGPGEGRGLWRHPISLARPGHSDQRPASWQCPSLPCVGLAAQAGAAVRRPPRLRCSVVVHERHTLSLRQAFQHAAHALKGADALERRRTGQRQTLARRSSTNAKSGSPCLRLLGVMNASA
jgi:hypothetical protein